MEWQLGEWPVMPKQMVSVRDRVLTVESKREGTKREKERNLTETAKGANIDQELRCQKKSIPGQNLT